MFAFNGLKVYLEPVNLDFAVYAIIFNNLNVSALRQFIIMRIMRILMLRSLVSKSVRNLLQLKLAFYLLHGWVVHLISPILLSFLLYDCI